MTRLALIATTAAAALFAGAAIAADFTISVALLQNSAGEGFTSRIHVVTRAA